MVTVLFTIAARWARAARRRSQAFARRGLGPIGAAILLAAAMFEASPASAQAQGQAAPFGRQYFIAWSPNIASAPWSYAQNFGIIDKWAERYGLKIAVVPVDSYLASLERYGRGEFDGVAATNIDALTFSASFGVRSTAILPSAFSNGLDAVVVKSPLAQEDMAGAEVHLVRFSVFQYLMHRCLEEVGLSDKDVRLVELDDTKILSTFEREDVLATVTREPKVSQILERTQSYPLCDTRDFPGEVIDMLLIKTDVLNERPELGEALAGAWYEAVGLLWDNTEEGDFVRAEMAAVAGLSQSEYMRKLALARLFYTPEGAVNFFESRGLRNIMGDVRRRLFNQDYFADSAGGPAGLAAGVSSMDDVGIELGGGDYIGDPSKLILQFDPSFAGAHIAPR